MAAKRPTLGVNHTTVVPTNFEPERSPERDDEVEADERDEDE
ncbi:hypothetical protein [Halorarum halobium]|nr:hypothetical protein [Halobaculum sp. XH14]